MSDLAARFPEGFLWGASTAAYQVEGAAFEDGRGESIWDRFCRRPGAVAGGDSGAVACDHYRRYREDVALMRDLGLGAYRFSVAWPRLLPEGRGAVNEAGLGFYDRLVDGLLGAGLEPWLCLYHWDLPQALEDLGGWRSRDSALWFADYAGLVARRLGDRVRRFATFNEPNVFTLLGHCFGAHAPGLSDQAATLAVIHHVNLAHGAAVERIRAEAAGAGIGAIHAIQPVVEASGRPEDRAARDLYDALWNRAFADPQNLGSYPAPLAGLIAPLVRAGDLEAIQRPLDFLGLNHYTRMRVAHHPGAPFAVAGRPPPPGREVTGMGWEVAPEAFAEAVAMTAARYPGLPVYVTENGAGYQDRLENGACADPARIAYLERYLGALAGAIEAGCDVRGYFVWSLMDNFEWHYGYAKRFGLIYVDYETQARVPKASYHWYRALVRGAVR